MAAVTGPAGVVEAFLAEVALPAEADAQLPTPNSVRRVSPPVPAVPPGYSSPLVVPVMVTLAELVPTVAVPVPVPPPVK